LLLGLIAVAAYQNDTKVEANVTSEAAVLAALYEDVLAEDRVAAVFGCWTSVSRKAVLPIFVPCWHLVILASASNRCYNCNN